MDGMDEIVSEFLVESHENLDQLDQDLISLERDPASRELLSSIFRTLHTIKGTSGFLAFHQLESVTHVGESLLSRLRDGDMVLTADTTTALLDMVDAVRALLGDIEQHGSETPRDYTALVSRLETLLETGGVLPAVSGTATTAATAGSAAASAAGGAPTDQDDAAAGAVAVALADAAPLEPATLEPAALEPTTLEPTGPLAATQAALEAAAVEAGLAVQPTEATAIVGAAVAQLADAVAGPAAPEEGRRAISDSTIRVDVELLDSLMNLVGELVLTRNQIVQRAVARDDSELLSSTHRLNIVAGELQEGVMKTRMQPIDNVWSKLPRVVRDLSLSLGKQVAVVMEGKETELDKTILEAVKDPLTHLVRNSVDHGIETPEARVAAGKPAEGTLLLRAYHEGGQVNIEITDDGAGIDPEKLRRKAVEKGIHTAESAARLGERELLNLVFAPGFSTAAAVTNVSGRGVGMDVVKTNIEKIGGLIDLSSVPGRGTTARIKIPLTLAIIPALVVTADEQRYAIPQVNLLELVRVEHGSSGPQVEHIHGTPVFRLRGNLLPLVYLREQLEQEPTDTGTTFIVVLQAGERQFGLVVDDIRDTEEIVVKPLGTQLRGVPLFAGATIMGDGRVVLILDAVNLAERAGMVADGHGTAGAAQTHAAEDSERASLLLLGLADGRRVGLPLAAVDRLEVLALQQLENVGGQEVVQYRGGILPLVRLDSVYGAYGHTEAEELQVVVCSSDGAPVGFVVHEIVDIVDATLSVRSGLDTGGHLGSAVVSDRVTELVDVAHAVRSLDPAALAPVPTSHGA